MSRPTTAKIFLNDVRQPIRLSAPSTDEVFAAFTSETGWVQGVTDQGRRFCAHSSDIKTVLGPVRPTVDFEADAICGRRITIREYEPWRQEQVDLAASNGEAPLFWSVYDGTHVVVLVDDDQARGSEGVVLVLGPDGEPVWTNPASDAEADRFYVAAAQAVVTAETAQAAADLTPDTIEDSRP